MPQREGAGTAPVAEHEKQLKEPEDYTVLLLNDDYTTMDFVVAVLESVFGKDASEAERIMMDVHQSGKGLVGLYPWDIAVTKAEQVHVMARRQEFPLRCLVEKA